MCALRREAGFGSGELFAAAANVITWTTRASEARGRGVPRSETFRRGCPQIRECSGPHPVSFRFWRWVGHIADDSSSTKQSVAAALVDNYR